MLSYKTSKNILLFTVSFVVITDALMLLQIIDARTSSPYINILINFLQIACLYTLRLTLKKHQESRWKLFAINAITFMMIVFIGYEILGLKYFGQGENIALLIQLFLLVTMLWLLIYTFYVVSILTVKSIGLKRYFKPYGVLLIICGYGGLIFQLCLNFIWLRTPLFAYGKYIYDAIALVPLMFLTWIYYKIEIGQQFFNVGDMVVSRRGFDGMPTGTTGLVLTKYQGKNKYEIEFSDARNSFINILLVQAEDIEHAPVITLEDKVNNWQLK